MKNNKWKKTVIIILFFLVLFIGFYLRITRLNLFDYREDTKRDREIIMKFFETKKPIYLGPQLSYGVDERCFGWVDEGCLHSGPLGFYLITIPYLISRNIEVVMIFYALLHIVAIILSYTFCSSFFNRKIALIAAMLFAISPLAIIILRTETTVQNPTPLFTLLLFYSLLGAIVKQQQKYIILVFISLAYLLQIHPTTAPLTIVAILILLFFKPQAKPRYYLIGIVVFTLLFSPFLYYEFTHKFENITLLLRIIFRYVSGNREHYPRTQVFDALLIHAGMLEGLPIKYTVVPTVLTALQKNIFTKIARISIFITSLLAIGGIFYIFYVWYQFRKKINILKYYVLLFWLVIPIGIYFIFPFTYSLSYTYFYHLYPLQFILAAICLSYFLESKIKIVKLISLILIFYIIISQLYFSLSLHFFNLDTSKAF